MNRVTEEHFIAATEAQSSTEATAKLRETYPSAAYNIFIVYQAHAVVRYVADVQRWPGLPSKIQPSLTDLLATQRIRTQMGGLPPLPQAPSSSAANAHANPAGGLALTPTQVSEIKTVARGMSAETQALAARLLAGHKAADGLTGRVEVSATSAPKGGNLQEAVFTQQSQATAVPSQASALPASARGVAQAEPAATTPFVPGKISAISVLKALRTAGR